MHQMTSKMNKLTRSMLLLLLLGLTAGCASFKGTGSKGSKGPTQYVEIPNPALTMSPGAPATIWVPRESEEGVPRGGELLKQGYQAVMGPGGTPAQGGIPSGSGTVVTPSLSPAQAGITAPGGKPVALVQRFGLVVALDGGRVYFNLGREAGLTPGQLLKVYRGGTFIEGLGLAPGEKVGTVEFQGFVGTGGYGVVKEGTAVRINDLIGAE